MFVRYTDIAYSICFQCHCRHVTFRPALLCEQSFLCALRGCPALCRGLMWSLGDCRLSISEVAGSVHCPSFCLPELLHSCAHVLPACLAGCL